MPNESCPNKTNFVANKESSFVIHSVHKKFNTKAIMKNFFMSPQIRKDYFIDFAEDAKSKS